jgi:catechol 2,3-dioxygenase-like lactoylglutathione lyase family enzyme
MDILGLHHVAVKTANFEAMRAFYTEVLGLPHVGGFPGRPVIFLGAGDTTIELVGGDAPAEPRGQGWAHVALRVASTDAAAAELAGRGISFHVAPKDFPPDAPTVRIAFFRDPDGNELELFEVLTPGS